MKVELAAASWWDRLLCGLLHVHERWRVADKLHRRCVTFGCGMVVVTETPLGRIRSKAREAATRALRGSGG